MNVEFFKKLSAVRRQLSEFGILKYNIVIPACPESSLSAYEVA
ncbi:MAG: hypothetical protein V4642_03095 [Bacteroidota bacterium]